jgi:hypothetical protein
MVAGFVLVQLAIFIGVIVFAVKLVNRLQEISKSQESIAMSQIQMVELLAKEQKANRSTDN